MHWLKKASLSVAVVAGFTRAAAVPEQGGEGVWIQSMLDRQAARYVAEPCRVGVSIAARIKGRTFFASDGVVKRGRQTRPTPDSIYELASVTKTFVGGLAAGALVDQRATLDGDFRAFLPSSYPNLAQSGVPITLRTLATHTAGLQRDLPDSDPILAAPDYDAIAGQFAALNKAYSRRGDLLALHTIALRSTPGSTFSYSNLGMRVLGYGLEGVYHQPLAELLSRRILRPLGMGSTGFAVASADRFRLVTPYNRHGKVQPFHDESAGAGYGLYSTPRDMARYLAWQVDRPDAVVRQSHRIIRGDAQRGEALIWNVGMKDGERLLWHGGGSFGETSQIVLFPEAQEGYVLLANDTCAGSEDTLKELAIGIRHALATTNKPHF